MKIERMNKGSWGKLRAFFDVQTDEGFTIKGFKIIEGINGLFVGPPSQKGKDEEYYDTVFIAPELREELNHTALQHYGMADEGNSGAFNDFPPPSNNITSENSTQVSNPAPINADIQSSTNNEVASKSQKDEVTSFEDDIPF
tara:strand:- start:713 stop:1138 length:426 start_codon:yes stop_codon:yes gene_type:complete